MSRGAALLAQFAARAPDIERLTSQHGRDPTAFARAALGIELDPWQERVLSWEGRGLLLNCSRQAGKSTTAGVRAVHRSVYRENFLTLLVSPSMRQSTELFRTALAMLHRLRIKPDIVEENKHAFALENGSRVVSLPSSESTIRGYSRVGQVIVDEASYVDDELVTAVRPMLAVSDGALILMSTPNGRRGFFFESWERGGKAWDREQISVHDVARISRDFVESERADFNRRGLGEVFRQEYECAFVNAATGRVYSSFDEDRNLIDAVPWKTKAREVIHLLGIDYGVTNDTAFAVLGWRPRDPTVYGVESFKEKGLSPSEAATIAKELDAAYGFVKMVGDIGGLGKGYVEEAHRRFHLPIEAAQKTNKNGYVALLNGELARARIKLVRGKCEPLVAEWLELPWREDRQKEEPGHANHCADAFLYAWRAATAFLEQETAPAPPRGSREALEVEAAALEQREVDALEREIAQPAPWYRKRDFSR